MARMVLQSLATLATLAALLATAHACTDADPKTFPAEIFAAAATCKAVKEIGACDDATANKLCCATCNAAPTVQCADSSSSDVSAATGGVYADCAAVRGGGFCTDGSVKSLCCATCAKKDAVVQCLDSAAAIVKNTSDSKIADCKAFKAGGYCDDAAALKPGAMCCLSCNTKAAVTCTDLSDAAVADSTSNALSSCSKARELGYCDTDDSTLGGAACCAACNTVVVLTCADAADAAVANATNNVLSSCSKARAGGFCDTDDSKAAGATCCAACNKVEELTCDDTADALVANATSNALSSCAGAKAGGFCDTDDSKIPGAQCCKSCNVVSTVICEDNTNDTAVSVATSGALSSCSVAQDKGFCDKDADRAPGSICCASCNKETTKTCTDGTDAAVKTDTDNKLTSCSLAKTNGFCDTDASRKPGAVCCLSCNTQAALICTDSSDGAVSNATSKALTSCSAAHAGGFCDAPADKAPGALCCATCTTPVVVTCVDSVAALNISTGGKYVTCAAFTAAKMCEGAGSRDPGAPCCSSCNSADENVTLASIDVTTAAVANATAAAVVVVGGVAVDANPFMPAECTAYLKTLVTDCAMTTGQVCTAGCKKAISEIPAACKAEVSVMQSVTGLQVAFKCGAAIKVEAKCTTVKLTQVLQKDCGLSLSDDLTSMGAARRICRKYTCMPAIKDMMAICLADADSADSQKIAQSMGDFVRAAVEVCNPRSCTNLHSLVNKSCGLPAYEVLQAPSTGAAACVNTEGEEYVEAAKACPAGQYTVISNGIIDCYGCIAGKFGKAGITKSSQCAVCGAGTYSDSKEGAGVCTACPTGKTTSSSAKYYYHNSVSDCRCSAGTYSPDSKTKCTDCPKGTYSKYAGIRKVNQCRVCSSGKYVAQGGATKCLDCPSGKTTSTKDAAGHDAATDCAAGAKCAAGKFGTAPRCYSCAAGKYNDAAGAAACKACAATARFSKAGATKAADCTSKMLCGVGQYAAGNSCLRCPRGKFGKASGVDSAQNCAECTMGRYGTQSGRSTSAQCRACPKGKYGGAAALTSYVQCRTCTRGRYADVGGIAMVNGTACTECSQGFTTRSTSYYKFRDSKRDCSIKVGCVAGSYGSGTLCFGCPVGTYRATTGAVSLKQCFLCPMGKYASDGGSKACASCPKGRSTKVMKKPDAESRDAVEDCSETSSCAKGKYDYKGYCRSCPKGRFSSEAGATMDTDCKICPQGTYNSRQGAAKCSSCPKGFTTRSTTGRRRLSHDERQYTYYVDSKSDCRYRTSSCAAGKYERSGRCVDCLAGKYSAKAGIGSSTQCIVCGKGRYTQFSGRTEEKAAASSSGCAACPAGKTTSSSSMYYFRNSEKACRGVLTCTAGKYKPFTTANFCRSCPRGTFGSSPGASSYKQCTTCAVGRYSQYYSAVGPAPADRRRLAAKAGDMPDGTKAGGAGGLPATGAGYGGLPATGAKGDVCQKVAAKGAVACCACPSGKTTQEIDSPIYRDSVTDCLAMSTCTAGSYQQGKSCRKCPSGKSSKAGSASIVQCFTECRAGRYRSSPTSNYCASCPKGKSSASGSTSKKDCVSGCVAGKYKFSGSSYCVSCPRGRFSSVSGVEGKSFSVCTVCKTGQYSAKPAATACSKCPEGKTTFSLAYSTYHDSAADCSRSVLKPCAAGKYALAGTCLGCPRGRYSSKIGLTSSAQCAVCPVGSFAANASAVACTRCPANTSTIAISKDYFRDSPADCSAEHVSLSMKASCKLGSFRIGSKCYECLAGTSNAKVGSASPRDCKLCAKGSFSAAKGSARCSPCPKGYTTSKYNYTYYRDSAKDCRYKDACAKGFFMLGASCRACPAGTASANAGATSHTTCAACAKGTFSDKAGSTKCSACTVGKTTKSTGAKRASSCDGAVYICPAAKYGSTKNTCISCPTGKASPMGSVAVKQCVAGCSAGKYKPASYKGSYCFYCYPGSYSAVGATSCSVCPQGTYASSYATAKCVGCPFGKTTSSAKSRYYRDSSKDCLFKEGAVQCLAGTYSPADASISKLSQCKICQTGSYTQYSGSTSCSKCPFGKTTSSVNKAASAHNSRWACNVKVAAADLECNKGSYLDTKAKKCVACARGTASATAGATSAAQCRICKKGSYASTTSSVACTACPTGTSTGDVKTASDVDSVFDCSVRTGCKLGYYLLKSKCYSCGKGTYAQKTGLTSSAQCTTCALGFYSTRYAATNCGACPSGRTTSSKDDKQAAAHNSLTDCAFLTGDGCAVGKYQYSASSAYCASCPSGKFSDRTGQVLSKSCITCATGEYNSKYGQSICTRCPKGRTTKKSTNRNDHNSAYDCNQRDGDCATGKYESGSNCYACPRGKYGKPKATSYRQCEICPVGRYTSFAGTSKKDGISEKEGCVSCPKGKSTSNSQYSFYRDSKNDCTVFVGDCPIGMYKLAGTCFRCPSGTYAFAKKAQGEWEPIAGGPQGPAPPPKKDPVKGPMPSPTKPATGPAPAKAPVKKPSPPPAKPAGRRLAATVKAANAPKPAPAKAKDVTKAPAGGDKPKTPAAPAGKSPTPTPAKTGLATCIVCPVGRYSSKSGAFTPTQCAACPKGKTTSKTDSYTYRNSLNDCNVLDGGCKAGYYQMTKSSNFCAACPRGKFSEKSGGVSSTSCTVCAVGRYSQYYGRTMKEAKDSEEGCAACPTGKTTVGTASSYYRDSVYDCSVLVGGCPTGKYQYSKASSFCSSCPSGKFNDKKGGVGSAACITCAVGRYTRYMGSSQKEAKDEKLGCAACPKGKSTKPAAKGYVPRNTDVNSEMDCSSFYVDGCKAGTYQISAVLMFCASCRPGSYSAKKGQVGSAACIICDVGRVSIMYGATDGNATDPKKGCAQCPKGKTTSSSKIISYRDSPFDCNVLIGGCPAGKFQNDKRSSYCYSCPKGSFNPKSGAVGRESCKICGMGRYTDVAATTSGNATSTKLGCVKCPTGRTTNDYQSSVFRDAVSDCSIGCDAPNFSGKPIKGCPPPPPVLKCKKGADLPDKDIAAATMGMHKSCKEVVDAGNCNMFYWPGATKSATKFPAVPAFLFKEPAGMIYSHVCCKSCPQPTGKEKSEDGKERDALVCKADNLRGLAGMAKRFQTDKYWGTVLGTANKDLMAKVRSCEDARKMKIMLVGQGKIAPKGYRIELDGCGPFFSVCCKTCMAPPPPPPSGSKCQCMCGGGGGFPTRPGGSQAPAPCLNARKDCDDLAKKDQKYCTGDKGKVECPLSCRACPTKPVAGPKPSPGPAIVVCNDTAKDCAASKKKDARFCTGDTGKKDCPLTCEAWSRTCPKPAGPKPAPVKCDDKKDTRDGKGACAKAMKADAKFCTSADVKADCALTCKLCRPAQGRRRMADVTAKGPAGAGAKPAVKASGPAPAKAACVDSDKAKCAASIKADKTYCTGDKTNEAARKACQLSCRACPVAARPAGGPSQSTKPVARPSGPMPSPSPPHTWKSSGTTGPDGQCKCICDGPTPGGAPSPPACKDVSKDCAASKKSDARFCTGDTGKKDCPLTCEAWSRTCPKPVAQRPGPAPAPKRPAAGPKPAGPKPAPAKPAPCKDANGMDACAKYKAGDRAYCTGAKGKADCALTCEAWSRTCPKPGGAQGRRRMQTKCVAGKYVLSSSCAACAGGTFSTTADAKACTVCATGEYSYTGSKECRKCRKGTTTKTSTDAKDHDNRRDCSIATSCKVGYVPKGGKCTLCNAGKFADAGAASCTVCAAGKYSTSRSIGCIRCPTGRYEAATGVAACGSICAVGKYNDARGSTSAAACKNCPSGKTTTLTSNQYYRKSARDCKYDACTTGTFRRGNSCVGCAPGRYATNPLTIKSESDCTLCSAGKYSSIMGATACKGCPAGFAAKTTSLEDVQDAYNKQQCKVTTCSKSISMFVSRCQANTEWSSAIQGLKGLFTSCNPTSCISQEKNVKSSCEDITDSDEDMATKICSSPRCTAALRAFRPGTECATTTLIDAAERTKIANAAASCDTSSCQGQLLSLKRVCGTYTLDLDVNGTATWCGSIECLKATKAFTDKCRRDTVTSVATAIATTGTTMTTCAATVAATDSSSCPALLVALAKCKSASDCAGCKAEVASFVAKCSDDLLVQRVSANRIRSFQDACDPNSCSSQLTGVAVTCGTATWPSTPKEVASICGNTKCVAAGSAFVKTCNPKSFPDDETVANYQQASKLIATCNDKCSLAIAQASSICGAFAAFTPRSKQCSDSKCTAALKVQLSACRKPYTKMSIAADSVIQMCQAATAAGVSVIQLKTCVAASSGGSRLVSCDRRVYHEKVFADAKCAGNVTAETRGVASGRCTPVTSLAATSICRDSAQVLCYGNYSIVKASCSATKKRCVDIFRCSSDAKMLPARFKCDGKEQCNDGSDEASCASTEKKCKLNNLFSRKDSQVCDGTCDCGSRCEDESRKYYGCAPMFKCASGKKIPGKRRCDGTADCEKGEDEDSCPFTCIDGSVVKAEARCDRTCDCQSGSCEDEANCQFEHVCAVSGEKVAESKVCDGTKDCQLGDDEALCEDKACADAYGTALSLGKAKGAAACPASTSQGACAYNAKYDECKAADYDDGADATDEQVIACTEEFSGVKKACCEDSSCAKLPYKVSSTCAMAFMPAYVGCKGLAAEDDLAVMKALFAKVTTSVDVKSFRRYCPNLVKITMPFIEKLCCEGGGCVDGTPTNCSTPCANVFAPVYSICKADFRGNVAAKAKEINFRCAESQCADDELRNCDNTGCVAKKNRGDGICDEELNCLKFFFDKSTSAKDNEVGDCENKVVAAVKQTTKGKVSLDAYVAGMKAATGGDAAEVTVTAVTQSVKASAELPLPGGVDAMKKSSSAVRKQVIEGIANALRVNQSAVVVKTVSKGAGGATAVVVDYEVKARVKGTDTLLVTRVDEENFFSELTDNINRAATAEAIQAGTAVPVLAKAAVKTGAFVGGSGGRRLREIELESAANNALPFERVTASSSPRRRLASNPTNPNDVATEIELSVQVDNDAANAGSGQNVSGADLAAKLADSANIAQKVSAANEEAGGEAVVVEKAELTAEIQTVLKVDGAKLTDANREGWIQRRKDALNFNSSSMKDKFKPSESTMDALKKLGASILAVIVAIPLLCCAMFCVCFKGRDKKTMAKVAPEARTSKKAFEP